MNSKASNLFLTEFIFKCPKNKFLEHFRCKKVTSFKAFFCLGFYRNSSSLLLWLIVIRVMAIMVIKSNQKTNKISVNKSGKVYNKLMKLWLHDEKVRGADLADTQLIHKYN